MLDYVIMKGYLYDVLLNYTIFTLVLVKVISEFLCLVYVSLHERVIRKFLDNGVLNDSLFSTEIIERQTLLALIFLPVLNFILSDLPVCIATNTSMLIPMLLLEVFMPMVSYYTGEKLSKEIKKEQIKNVEYKEILVRAHSLKDWPKGWVRKRVPIVYLNEKMISKTIRLIYMNYKTIFLFHSLLLSTCLILCYTVLWY